MPMTSEQLELLRNLAKATQLRYLDAVEQWERNWRIARGSNKVMPVLAGRMGLVDYMAAAQILDDQPAYEAAATTILSHASELASLFKPLPEVLLVDLDHDLARKLAGQLLQACAARQFDKATTEQAEQWAVATSKLADRDLEGCATALAALQALHFKRIERELSRLKRGASSALMACDLVDLPGNALRVLLSESGYNAQQVGAAQVWEMPSTSTVVV